MDSITQNIASINDAVNGVVWGWPAIILLAFVGILMTALFNAPRPADRGADAPSTELKGNGYDESH